MKQLAAVTCLFAFVFFGPLPCAAQGRSLAGVKTIRMVTYPDDSVAMNNALIRQIQRSGVFEVVLNSNDPADASLVPMYGCNTRTGEFLPEAERHSRHGFCTISLFDTVAEDADGRPLRIWSGRAWRVPELYLEVEQLKEAGQSVDLQDFVASAVIEELLIDRKASLDGQPQSPTDTLSLLQVKKVFVSLADYSNETSADKLLEGEMFRQLVRWREVRDGGKKKWAFYGDCSTGYESLLSGVRLVCNPAQADAILIGPYTQSHAGPVTYTGTGYATTTLNPDGTTADTESRVTVREHQQITEAGTAILFDRRTGKTIWSATRNDYQWWVGALGGGANGGPAVVVEKLAKQLRKDYEKAARAH